MQRVGAISLEQKACRVLPCLGFVGLPEGAGACCGVSIRRLRGLFVPLTLRAALEAALHGGLAGEDNRPRKSCRRKDLGETFPFLPLTARPVCAHGRERTV